MSIVRQGSLKNNVKCLIACAVFSAGFCFLSNSNSFAKEEKKQDIEHYNIQAKIAYNNGKYEEALGWWDKTIAADPENKEALSQVKKVRLKLDQIKEKKEKRSPRKEAAASVAQGQKQVLPELPAKPVIEIAPASEATREPEKKTGTSAVEEPKKADGAVPAAVTEPAKTTAPVKEAASKAAEGQPRAVANKTAIPAQKLLVPANAAQENSKSAIQAGKERKVEAYIAEGKVYYGQRRFSWAISEWQKALKLDPSNKTVTGYIERAGERIKKKDQGKLPLEIDMLSGAAKANALAAADKSQTPDIAWENEEGLKQTIERYTSEGKKYYGQHHFEWAISEWRKALKLDPTNKTVSGYIDRAQERLTKKTQDKGPLETEMLAGVAKVNALVAVDKPLSPVVSWEDTEDLKKKIAAYIAEGKTYYGQHHFEWAISEWQKALKLDPSNKTVAGYIERATARITGKVERKKALESDMIVSRPAPDPAVIQAGVQRKVAAYIREGRVYYGQRRFSWAISEWRKALKLDPSNVTAAAYIKRVEERFKKEAHEQEPLEPAMLVRPAPDDTPEARVKRKAAAYILEGKKYYAKEQFSWAISEWENALRFDPSSKEAASYIERTRARLQRSPADRGPLEPDMLAKPPVPETPEPVFVKPDKDAASLEEIIAVGVQNHLPIQIAREQVKLSRYKEKESFRELFPTATIRYDETTGVVSSKNYVGKKYQLRLQHPLYHGGELRYTWEQAKVNLKIAQQNYVKTQEDYIVEVSRAYYDYVKAIKNRDIQDALLKELERDLAMAKKEYEGKITTLVEFLNIQSQYNQAYYAYLSSDNTLGLAKLNFLQLLNLDRDPSVTVKIDTGIEFKDHAIDLEKCIELAYQNRTDLKINELGLKSAELGEHITNSQQLPKIDLISNIGKSGEAYSTDPLQMSNDWFVGAKVNVPWGPNSVNYSLTKENIAPSISVFGPTKDTVNSLKFNILDNLASYTEAKRTEVATQQAYAELLKGKQTAATQVREAYFNYQETAIKVKNSIANKELYQKELVIAREKRLMNEAMTTDIVTAKVKMAGEESNYVAVVIENIQALQKLNKAIGIRNYFK